MNASYRLFVFLQVTGARLGYWRNMIETGRAEYERTVGAFPRFDIEIAGVVPTLEATPANAVAWLYYLTVLLPALTLLVVTLDVYRRRHGVRVLARPAMANEAQKTRIAPVGAYGPRALPCFRAAGEAAESHDAAD